MSGDFHASGTLNQAEFDNLKRALKDAGYEASNTLRGDLKKAAKIGVERIQAGTPVYKGGGYSGGRGARRSSVTQTGSTGATRTYSGTHTPGLLKRSTRLKTSTKLEVRIYNNAKQVSRKWPGGYRYGKRLEFDPAFSGRFAFFYKGWEEAKAQVHAAFGDVLDNAYKAFVRGGR